ncbi:hypothetical protein F3J14_27510 [Burkholderia sp. Tr-862]|nr:hypothetical protein [Burkholderia sp. Tr-862]
MFGVVAEQAVHARIGTVVRARAGAHHRNSQGLECPRAAISTPLPASLRVDLGTSPLGFPVHYLVGGVRYRFDAGPASFTVNASFDCAAARAEAGRRCGYPAAESTHDPVHPKGEGERRSGEAGMRRCGYLLPASTRRAVDFNGERRNPLQLWTDRGVDIRPPTRLETLCD